jgi:hypothetical protein
MQSDDTTVVLVGAGAVRGAWPPVLDALRKVGFADVVTLDAANFAMPRLVYIARIAERDNEGTGIGRRRRDVREFLKHVKSTICVELRAAEAAGALSVHAEFRQVMQRLVLREGTHFQLVTTNWDHTVEHEFRLLRKDLEVFPLHGHVDDPNGLYLPTEVVEEPYRDRAELVELNNRRALLVRAITHAKRLVVYGLGLSSLDVELGQVLASGIHESTVREVVVVDPQYVRVAERIATLNDAGAKSLPIRCCRPERLEEQWTFTAAAVGEEQVRLDAMDSAT